MTEYTEDLTKAYNDVHSHCIPEMKMMMRGYHNYEAVELSGDVIGLMNIIKSLIFKKFREEYVVKSVLNHLRDYIQCIQRNKSNQEYF